MTSQLPSWKPETTWVARRLLKQTICPNVSIFVPMQILSKNYIPKFELSTTDEKNAKAVYETKIAEISDLLNKHVDRLRDKSPVS